MPSIDRRVAVLAGLVVALSLVSLYFLRGVLATVFFAITVAYVVYPLRSWLVARGLQRRIAAGLSTVVVFLVGLLLLAPLAYVVYARSMQIVDFVRELPTALVLAVGEFSYTVELEALREAAVAAAGNIGIAAARATPVLGLKAFLFTLLVYALLLRPGEVHRGILRPVPHRYHDVVERLHVTVRDTLYALYLLQAATAFGTFVIAFALFAVLKYDPAITLAVIAGLLQFIPIIGPSVLIAVLGAVAYMGNDPTLAIAVVVLGLVLVGFLPDALIRPRLADYTTGMPGSLYFIGFTGGILSVGAVGVIAGPLLVALLSEATRLLAEERDDQQTLFEPE